MQEPKRWKSALTNPYAMTFLTEGVVAISQLLLYRMAGMLWGSHGFAELALTRRTIALLNPPIVFGLAVALPRQLGFTRAGDAEGRSTSYLAAALMISLSLALIILTVLNVFPALWARLFFGDEAYATLVFPMSVMLAGLSLHTVCYSYYRGMRIGLANLLQLLVLGVLPVATALLFTRTLGEYYLALGLASFICAALALVPAAMKIETSRQEVAQHLRRLLRIAAPRMPGELLLVLCFALPATITAHVSGVATAGYLAFGISMLIMIGAAITPIGLVFLPHASELVARRDVAQLRKQVARLALICTTVTVGATIVLEWTLNFFLLLFAGQSSPEAIRISQVLILAAIPYGAYLAFRNVLDACRDRALNTMNIAISGAVFLLCCYLTFVFHISGSLPVAVSFLISLWVLGGLTVLRTVQVLGSFRDCHRPFVDVQQTTAA